MRPARYFSIIQLSNSRNAVDAVVNRGEDPDQVLLDLFMRSLKKEF